MAKLNIEPLSQRDSGWARQKLGNGTGTISGFGCILLSVCMQVRYYGKDVDPLKLNIAMKMVKGWRGASKNLFDWPFLNKIYSDIKWIGRHNFETNPADLTILDSQLEKKQPVIAKVEADEIGTPKGTHFVLIIGKDGDDYIINDPWWRPSDSHPQQFKLGDYYSHNGSKKPEHIILGFRIFEGPINAPEEDKDLDLTIKEIKKFQDGENINKVKFGNMESAVRASFGSYNELPGKIEQLKNADKLAKTKMESALTTQKAQFDRAKVKFNGEWQSKMDIAKNALTTLKKKWEKTRINALNDTPKKELFKAWITKILGGEVKKNEKNT